ncbi:electron transfer flavoprotein subunit alpha/FixB family protein [Syntrophomonas palmitatica]|uniref:electron transfer flavoprotein subunit alpha/FixB family protein n=1 Tax=Syntrophomonas palmitatica TaxID=402877 RepID=UPI0006D28E3B|nr:electron transfer flavoprotein subunit alpha/FixB family protein [Syntrophomonas palmitatica]
MAGIWILADNLTNSQELLFAGKLLAEKIKHPLAAFSWQEENNQAMIDCGADEVLCLPPLGEGESLDAYIQPIIDYALQDKPEVILVAARLQLKVLAARIASRLDTGLISDCHRLQWNSELNCLEGQRSILGGSGVETVCCPNKPSMATIALHAFEKASPQPGREGKVTRLSSSGTSPVKILEKRAKAKEGSDIGGAQRIVCVGRGFEKEADLAMARELAELLGAELACTRPISQEMHWMSEDRCIGLSARQVKPDFYIGLGISGQIQHLTGLRDARTICAINNDESAPIFGAADYGIEGDLYEVLPLMIAELKSRS